MGSLAQHQAKVIMYIVYYIYLHVIVYEWKRMIEEEGYYTNTKLYLQEIRDL